MAYRKSAHRPLLASMKDILSDGRLRRPLEQLAAAGLGALTPLAALASPTGGQVVAGSATISNPNPNGTVINQTSQNAAINWQQFSVGANQYVQFIQPDSSAVVLNRVIGGNLSSIFGDIKANGQVFLVNPNGILFGKGAVLDVNGLVASTLDISTSDFMHGNYVFSKGSPDSDALVLNQGSINARPGGYVVLAGDYVENDGVINAQGGRVYLAAGGSATLTMDQNSLISYTVDSATLARLAGAVNTGQIAADGGAVVMTGDVANALTATAVNNTGFIAAHSIKNEGGEIVLEAQGGALYNSGTLDASATQAGVAGGTIVLHGTGLTQLTPASVITTAGDGAHGGFIDLSGHDLAIRGEVTAGKGGSLLLDPTTINIVNGSASAGGTNVNSVGVGFIQNKLTNGSNVTLVATGTIDNASAATRVINANGTGRFDLVTGTVTANSQCAGAVHGVCVGIGSFPSVTVGNGTINLKGLSITIKGAFALDAGQGAVTLGSISAAQGISAVGGNIQVDGNLTAPAAILRLSANQGVVPGAFIKTAPGVKLKGGAVLLNMGGSYGGVISVGTISATGSASLGLNYTTLFSPTSPEKIVTGNITGKRINVSAAGPKTSIDINGSMAAVNPTGQATVSISADGKGGAALITVNGNITVSGKQNASSGSLRPFDMPTAAGVRIQAFGSGSGAHTAKVNGNVSVTAVGGSYSRTSGCECGPPTRRQSGNGGVAAAYIIATGSHGVASVNGSIDAKGPDAHVGVLANKVTVNGNISVTGSGHKVTRTVPLTSGASYTSSNSAGQATLQLGAGQVFVGSPAAQTVVLNNTIKVAGNITVSGKGVAEAALFGSNISAGNITVKATAASGKLKQKGSTIGACTHFATDDCTDLNSIGFYRGIDHAALHSGSIDAGRADIFIGGGTSITSGSNGAQALNVKLGTLSANGVGQATVSLNGKAMTTQGLTAIATKGTEKGTGSSQSGVTAVTTFAHTFDINGGGAEVRIRSGNSGSHSSGVLTQNGGPVTINGNISATGPAASVDVKGKTINVAGTLGVTGSGGSVTSDTVVTGPTAYHTHFTGNEPTSINLQGGASGSVNVAGKTSIKAPGIIGVIMVGGNVKLNGFSGSASAAVNYSILDTRVSPTTQNFTAASFGLIVAGVKAVGGKPAFGSASDTGDVTVKSKGNVNLPDMIKISGNLNVQAVGNIVGSSNGLIGQFNAIDAARPRAGSHNGGPSNGVTLPHLAATVNAVSMVAGKGINLSGTQLNIGNGSISSVHGDSTLILGLAAAGLSPAAPNPNGAFIADGTVTLGGIKLTGSYLLLQGTAVSVLGKVSTPAGTLVQVLPFDPTEPIDIEDSTLSSSTQGLTAVSGSTTFGLTNSAFLALFPGDTVAVGGSLEAGAVTIGTNGPLDIGSTNLVIDTSGDITGLGTVTSTGVVNSLLNLLGPIVPPVTVGEIDPTAGSTNTGLGDQTDKKHLGQPGGLGDEGQQGGTISNDTNGSGVCH